MSLEYKIKTMDLLNEIGLKRTKGLQLKINSVNISPDLISQIEKVCNEYSGVCPLYFKIEDDQEKVIVETLSRKFRVKPVNEMVTRFKKIKDLSVEIV
jgi:DNA polymerase-3 subunit alpha